MDHAEYKSLCQKTESNPALEKGLDVTLFKKCMEFAGACGALVDIVKTKAFYGREVKQENILITCSLVSQRLNALLYCLLTPNYHLEKPKCSVSLIHGTLGHITEAGEMADDIAKALDEGMTPELQQNLQAEVSDAEWYTSIMLDPLFITRPEVWEKNIAKLKKRFPEGFFTAERANVRDTAVENQAFQQA